MKTFTIAFVSVLLPWKQNWRNWQEVENANSAINNAESFVNNYMICSIGVLMHR